MVLKRRLDQPLSPHTFKQRNYRLKNILPTIFKFLLEKHVCNSAMDLSPMTEMHQQLLSNNTFWRGISGLGPEHIGMGNSGTVKVQSNVLKRIMHSG